VSKTCTPRFTPPWKRKKETERMPKVVDGIAQRADIRSAARRAFASRGVAGTGLAHVAQEAGMGRSSLYHYYPDKQALVRDLVEDLLRQEGALLARALEGGGPPLARIERLSRALPAVLEAWSELGTMIFDLWSRDAVQFRPFLQQMRKSLAELIAQGQRGGEIDAGLDPELTAAVVIGAIDGLLLQHLIDPEAFEDFDAMGDTIARVIRKGLQA
jgi:TetR/AcrR family fatty acid metabolism transcriptional regulator